MLTLVEAEKAKSEEIAENGNVDDEAGSSIYGYYDRTIPGSAGHSEALKQISAFYKAFSAKQGIHCDARQEAGVWNSQQLLQDIAGEQGFMVTYKDLPGLGKSGKHQCLIELVTKQEPFLNHHGSGDSRDAAHDNAAKNMLNNLQMVAQNTRRRLMHSASDI